MKCQLGLTLLEVMLTIVILASVASLVAVVLPSQTQYYLEQVVSKLTLKIKVASDQALIYGTHYGLSFTDDSYVFFRLENGRWVASGAPIHIPDNIHFNLLKIEELSPTREQIERKPQIWLWTNGTITPFSVSVRGKDHQYEVVVNSLGEIEKK